jgi:hypothetical protein
VAGGRVALGAKLIAQTPMTDTFASESHTPNVGSSNAAEPAGDVTGTLAELERKLRELEQELTSIGRRRELGGSPTGTAPQAGGRLVDEAIEPQGPVAHEKPVEPESPPRPVALQRPAEPEGLGQPVKFTRPIRPVTAREPARESTGEALGRSEAQGAPAPQGTPRPTVTPAPQITPAQKVTPTPQVTPAPQERPRPSEAQLASLAELRRFRDRLERFARDLAAEYDALLGRVMTGLTSASPVAPQPPTADPAPAPPVQAAPSPEDALFEGRVELGVGPFYDIASLSAFERRLASLPNVVEASVRRFEASHAVVDLRLAAPMALVVELRRAMDSDFSVREVADGRILLTFDEA